MAREAFVYVLQMIIIRLIQLTEEDLKEMYHCIKMADQGQLCTSPKALEGDTKDIF